MVYDNYNVVDSDDILYTYSALNYDVVNGDDIYL